MTLGWKHEVFLTERPLYINVLILQHSESKMPNLSSVGDSIRTQSPLPSTPTPLCFLTMNCTK